MIHLARMGATAGVVLCTVLPYLGGRHDVLAVGMSIAAQVAGVASLTLVPVGILWLAQASLRPAGAPSAERTRHRYTLAVLALLTMTGLLAALVVAAVSSISFGAGMVIVSTTLAWVGVRRSKQRIQTERGPDRVTPLYCIIAPIALVLIQGVVATPAEEFARDRAIRNSAGLISDIERYRAARGRYPSSLHSVWADYSPAVIGIGGYHYEPQGEAYNLFFEQPSFDFGARVFVMFNPRDEQVMTSHKMDLLQLAPEDLERQRGFFALRSASHPHWKYFVFD